MDTVSQPLEVWKNIMRRMTKTGLALDLNISKIEIFSVVKASSNSFNSWSKS